MTNANNDFGSSMGSENFYQNQLSHVIYTDGVKQMAEACGAYWLIDLVSGHQTSKTVNIEQFQVWQLQRVVDDVFKITATDGNERRLTQQEIPFSDFKYDSATLWLVNGCLMLPQEY